MKVWHVCNDDMLIAAFYRALVSFLEAYMLTVFPRATISIRVLHGTCGVWFSDVGHLTHALSIASLVILIPSNSRRLESS